jgi:hypothetical protein
MKTKQLALDVLKRLCVFGDKATAIASPAIAAIEADIAKPAEPVAYMTNDGRVSMRETVETAMPRTTKESFNIPLYTTPQEPSAAGWIPIETAPKNQKEMFIVKAFNAESHGGARYTSDPWGVWVENGHFIRWPHKFNPTHWMPLPAAPAK